MGAIERYGAWDKVKAMLARASATLMPTAEEVLAEEAEFARDRIREELTSQRGAARQTGTRAVQQLRGQQHTFDASVIATRRRRGSVFIGIPLSAKTRDGKSAARVAAVREHGAGPFAVKITPKSRRFLAMAFRRYGMPPKLARGRGFALVRVPERPFMAPVWQRYYAGRGLRTRVVLRRLMQRLGM